MTILMKKKTLSYVSKVNMKNTLLKENNNKMSYVSEVIKFSHKKKNEVIKKKGFWKKKKKDSFICQLKLPYRVEFSKMDRNKWEKLDP